MSHHGGTGTSVLTSPRLLARSDPRGFPVSAARGKHPPAPAVPGLSAVRLPGDLAPQWGCARAALPAGAGLPRLGAL